MVDLRGGDQQPGAAVVEHGVQVAGGRLDAERDGGTARAQHGEQRDAQLGAGGQVQGDPVALGQPGRGQRRGVGDDGVAGLRPAQGHPGGDVDQGPVPADGSRRGVDEAGEIACPAVEWDEGGVGHRHLFLDTLCWRVQTQCVMSH